MILPKPIGKFVAVFRGEVAPILILLSALLGLWFGMTPGWQGIHVALLVLALVLNVHVGLFLMFAGLGKSFAFAAAPLLFHTGVWVQGHVPGLLEALSATPLIGISDYSRCAVAGSLLWGPLLGVAAGLLLARSVGSFRKTWLRMEEGSQAFREWRQKGWVRLLDRLLIGKSAKDVRAVLKRRARIVRLPGVVLAIVVICASGIGAYWLQRTHLAEYAADSLTKVNGAEVNLARVELALLAGRVSVEGLQMTDPRNPTHDRIAVDALTADVSVWNLLRGRVVVDNVELAGVRFDQLRKSPGRLTASVAAPEPPADGFDLSQFGLPQVSADTLESYAANVEQVREYFQTVSRWLPDPDQAAEPEPAPVPETYLAHLSARARRAPTPRFLVRRLVLEDVEIPFEQLSRSRIECRNLSDAPRAAGVPVVIEMRSLERSASIRLVCHYEEPQRGAEIAASFEKVELQRLQGQLKTTNPVVFEGGTASASVSGKATRGTIDLTIAVKTAGMRARTVGGGLFGLDPQVSEEAIKALDQIDTTLRLVGPTARPRLVFDGKAMSEQFRDALVRAGKDELAKRVDTLLAGKLPEGVPDVKQVLEKPEDAIKQTIGGLLSGQLAKKGDPKKPTSKPSEDEDPLSRLKKKLKKPKKP